MSRFPCQLETERLILRPPEQADAEGLIDAVAASSAELTGWMPRATKPYYGAEELRDLLEGLGAKLEDEAGR